MLIANPACAAVSASGGAESVVHQLYGIRIRTPWPLPYAARKADVAWDVEFVAGDPEVLAQASKFVPASERSSWYQRAILPDGSYYCRWVDLLEFLVSANGRRIEARFLKYAAEEAFQAYLLVQGLSFSMVHMGREPLHATAVLTDHGLVAFMGESGRGKSTLGALFVEAGFPLLTDDLLVLAPTDGGFLAHPGPPRIKLYRKIAVQIFGAAYQGVPMNPATEKLIIPLTARQSVTEPQVLRALYQICDARTGGRRRSPFIRRVSPPRAFTKILEATMNGWAGDSERPKQMFEFATDLVQTVPIKTISYPRNRDEMWRVRDAVLEDLARSESKG